MAKRKFDEVEYGVKFPHSPILHYAFSSWIEKTMTKQYIAIGKTDLFYNSMGLCGNFTFNCFTIFKSI